jgi:hypothetical protein
MYCFKEERRMRIIKALSLLSLLAVLATGCGPLPDNITINIVVPTQDVNQIVQATFQAMTAQVGSLPTSTPLPAGGLPTSTLASVTLTSSTGSLAGSLNYPAESVPSMFVVAYLVGSQDYQYVISKAGQGKFQIDNLKPGVYHVIAYTVGGGSFPVGLAGGYTKAVPCGLSSNCTDHTLIDVVVSAGKTTSGINPFDWYAPQGTFSAFPQQAAVATNVPANVPTLPPAIADGSISGNLMYPASGIPALRIVATKVGTSNYYYIDTSLGQSSYQLDHIPPGTYHVVAYVLPGGKFTGGLPGGYSKMVPCGLTYGCNDHTLIDVIVTSGNVTSGVNPNDYYADAGTFPPDPVP